MASNPRIDDLRKRLAKEPGSRLFAQLAEELRKAGELEEAIQVCQDGLQKNPNYPSARMTLGRALFDTGDHAAAVGELESVVKGAPDNILAGRLLGEALEALGRYPEAEQRYRKTLLLSPGDKQIQARLDALAAGPPPPPAAVAPGPAALAPPPQVADVVLPPMDLPPIALVDADEEFELDRPAAPVPPARELVFRPIEELAPAPPPPARPAGIGERVMEFEMPAEPAAVSAPSAGAGSLPVGERELEFDEPEAGSPAKGDVTELASPTLAELYAAQGHVEDAVAVYRELAAREPGRAEVQSRLAELETGTGPAPGSASRVAAIERTIARLEALRSALTAARA